MVESMIVAGAVAFVIVVAVTRTRGGIRRRRAVG
jgi:hypothetical protein